MLQIAKALETKLYKLFKVLINSMDLYLLFSIPFLAYKSYKRSVYEGFTHYYLCLKDTQAL